MVMRGNIEYRGEQEEYDGCEYQKQEGNIDVLKTLQPCSPYYTSLSQQSTPGSMVYSGGRGK